MEQDKPFKTIEVVDSDTHQTCKIACMSCIRGHRTTSCGIPVCRTKIFWTVKRPGRPSNSCTCRFNSSGVCKCVTAIPKCPHKSKKGEKRSSECRCDEQGRFCCLLDPSHWERLFALEKPTVQFYASRYALDEAQVMQRSTITSPATPSANSTNFTPKMSSCCGGSRGDSTPDTSTIFPTPRLTRSIIPSPRGSISSPNGPQSIMPHLGYVSVSAMMDPSTSPVPNIMAWDNDTPSASGTFSPAPVHEEPEELGSCCERARVDEYETPSSSQFDPTYSAFSTTSTAPPSYTFDFERWNQNYHIYQFPNAICQNCGLNGCTCRSCPPLMQNFGTTSWAQSCGRRHARIAPMPQPVPITLAEEPSMKFEQPPLDFQQHHNHISSHQVEEQHFMSPQDDFLTLPNTNPNIHEPPRSHELPYHTNGHVVSDPFSPHEDFLASGMTEPMGFPDYMVHRLDPPSQAMDHDMFGD